MSRSSLQRTRLLLLLRAQRVLVLGLLRRPSRGRGFGSLPEALRLCHLARAARSRARGRVELRAGARQRLPLLVRLEVGPRSKESVAPAASYLHQLENHTETASQELRCDSKSSLIFPKSSRQ